MRVFGRGSRVRTRDLRFWRPSLYQLSYTPSGRGEGVHGRAGEIKGPRTGKCTSCAARLITGPHARRHALSRRWLRIETLGDFYLHAVRSKTCDSDFCHLIRAHRSRHVEPPPPRFSQAGLGRTKAVPGRTGTGQIGRLSRTRSGEPFGISS